jgi:hypothetical protein
MIEQYLQQSNETCYSVLQEFETLKKLNFSRLNKVVIVKQTSPKKKYLVVKQTSPRKKVVVKETSSRDHLLDTNTQCC